MSLGVYAGFCTGGTTSISSFVVSGGAEDSLRAHQTPAMMTPVAAAPKIGGDQPIGTTKTQIRYMLASTVVAIVTGMPVRM